MSRPTVFPSFFLVGAPRCGTTALSHWLRANPSVCFSDPKEPHFFSHTCCEQRVRDLERAYVRRFFPHYDPACHQAMGEGSVSYLYEPQAIRRILDIDPEARFVAMVRSPLEMLPSYHLRLQYIIEEDVGDFARAWELQEERARGAKLPRRCTDPRLLRYAEIGRLGRHVERLREMAGPAQCHIVVYDDLRERPREVYRDLLRFVGAEEDGRSCFETCQASKVFRSRRLQQLLLKPPRTVARLPGDVRTSRSPAATALKRLRKRILRKNHHRRPPAPLAPEMRETLQRSFASDVELLGRILGRDLSHWLEGETRRVAA